jgi:hypothetical protein
LWLGNAAAPELEQGYKPAFFGQKDLKPGLEFCVFDDGFLADERIVGLDIGRGNELKWANRITVLIADPGEVFFIG